MVKLQCTYLFLFSSPPGNSKIDLQTELGGDQAESRTFRSFPKRHCTVQVTTSRYKVECYRRLDFTVQSLVPDSTD